MNGMVWRRVLTVTVHVRRICSSKGSGVENGLKGLSASPATPVQSENSSRVENSSSVEEKRTRKAQSRARNLEILKQKRAKGLHPNQANAKLDSQRGIEMFLDIDGGAGVRRTGRAWKSSELRLKSFDDLHRLWFLLLKERNVLLTERAWCKTNGRHWSNGMSNLYKVRHSMARVKGVVGERVRAIRAQRAKNALQSEIEGSHDDPQGTVDEPQEEIVQKKGQHKNVNKNWYWKKQNEVSKSGTPLHV